MIVLVAPQLVRELAVAAAQLQVLERASALELPQQPGEWAQASEQLRLPEEPVQVSVPRRSAAVLALWQ